MEVFRELHVRASGSEELVALMDDVEKSLPAGWTRDRIMESRFHEGLLDPPTKRFFFFSYDGDNRLPSATIVLAEEVPGLLILSNIIPRKRPELSITESNAVLEEFTERLLRPCAERLGSQIHLKSSQKDLTDWLSSEAVAKFRKFSEGANRRAGYLLRADRDRWLEFLLAAHHDRSHLEPSILKRWLIEVERWSPEVADQLAGEYAFGGELMSFSETHRAGA